MTDCWHRGAACTNDADREEYVFVPDGITKARLCPQCADELATNGRQRWEAEEQAAADDGEPPNGSEVVVVGGRLDGARYVRRDSTDPVLVALNGHHQWWDSSGAMYADWTYRKREAEQGGGRLVLVVS